MKATKLQIQTAEITARTIRYAQLELGRVVEHLDPEQADRVFHDMLAGFVTASIESVCINHPEMRSASLIEVAIRLQSVAEAWKREEMT